MPGLFTGATGTWGGFAGLLYGSTSLSTPPGFLADVGGGASFSPASLFAAGEPGVWYDPSDFSTMFQDSVGTTPVTAVEQPVGLLLDKSQGLVLGSNLAATLPTPTIFDAGGTVGTWNASTRTFGNTGANVSARPRFNFNLGMTAGRTYLVDGQLSGAIAQLNLVRLGSSTGTNIYTPATGRIFGRVAADDAFLHFQFSLNNGSTVTIDNISVREIAGNHATQATSASRPVLSARVNLLLATATLATQSVTTAAATYTLAFSGDGTVTTTGTNIGVYSAGTHSITCTAGTLTLTVVGSVTTADLRVTNDGVGLPAYQAVVTSTNYDTTGFPYYLRFDGTDDSMATASIDPGLVNKAQVFFGISALTPRSNNSPVWQFGDTTTSATDALLRFLTGDGSTDSYRAYLIGTSVNQTPRVTKVFPFNSVFSNIFDAAVTGSGEISVTENATVTAIGSATDSGLTSFGSQVLYVGRQNTLVGYLNGRIYSLIVRFGANLDATTIDNTEQWISGKMGGGYYPTGYDFLVDANGDQITDASNNPLFTQVLYT